MACPGYEFSTFEGIYDDNRALTAIKETVQDITERKQAEEKQRTLKANYQTIFDSGYDPIVIRDMETGEIVDVNKRMCEMFGYTHDQALNLNVEEISLARTGIFASRSRRMDSQGDNTGAANIRVDL